MTRNDPDAPEVVGSVINRRLDFIKKKHGKVGLDRFFQIINARMPMEEPLGPKSFKDTDYYPFNLYLDIIHASWDVVGPENDATKIRMEEAIAQDIGLLKFFVKWGLPPDEMAKKAAEYWRRFHRLGDLTAVEIAEGKAVVRLTDYFESPDFCYTLQHYLTGLVKLTAKKASTDHSACVARGDPYCEFVITWSK